MRTVEEHLARCLAAVRPAPPEAMSLLDALGCLLAEDVAAEVAVPRFDNSAMDGYAVQAADIAWAAPDAPVVLPVVADLPAGVGEPMRLVAGTAVRIMTGAPLPAGADAVVPVEQTDAGLHEVRVLTPVAVGRHVRRAAEDVAAGEIVVRAGTRVTARHVALLAAVGRGRVSAVRRPRVAVFSTGSELVTAGEALAPGHIPDANGPALTAAARQAGADAVFAGIVDDNPTAVLGSLEHWAEQADVIVTSGGVSAGAYDVVKAVLSRLGTVEFGKVAMQPGMPQGFGTLGSRSVPVFALPGNPVSALVGFELFVRPALRAMAGHPPTPAALDTATASQGWPSPPGKRQYVRARLRRAEGAAWVTPVGGQGSHLVADLADADCLAVVPEDVAEVRAGDVLWIVPLPGSDA